MVACRMYQTDQPSMVLDSPTSKLVLAVIPPFARHIFLIGNGWCTNPLGRSSQFELWSGVAAEGGNNVLQCEAAEDLP